MPEITLSAVLDLARARNSLDSDRKLAQALDVTPTMFTGYRRGWTHPGDETMIRLADLAGIDRTEALVMLHEWKTDGETRNVWRQIRAALPKTAAGLSLAFMLWGTGADESANAAQIENKRPSELSTLYIMRVCI